MTSPNVLELVTKLCESFISVSTPFYTTRAEIKQIEEKHCRSLRSKAFDRLLFSYDEEFNVNAVRDQAEHVKLPSNNDAFDDVTASRLNTTLQQLLGKVPTIFITPSLQTGDAFQFNCLSLSST